MRPERVPKAIAAAPDIVCVDLEDAVPHDRKAEARALAFPLFAGLDGAEPVERVLRINSIRGREGLRDLDAILGLAEPPPAIMLPKVRSGDEVALIDELLSQGPASRIRFHVIIETADALEQVHEIAASSARVDALLFGGVDLSADLRVAKSWEALLYARSRVVHAAARAGIDVLDVPSLVLDDPEGLEREAAAARALGFLGKAAIHPGQLSPIHAAFTPGADEIARARRIVAAFAQSATGLMVVEGELIEPPVLRSMQRVLAIADRLGMT